MDASEILHFDDAGCAREGRAVEIYPGRLWSLWDMLQTFALAFEVIGETIANAERDLLKYLGGPGENTTLTFDSQTLTETNNFLALIAQLNGPVELQPIIKDVKKLYVRLNEPNALRQIVTVEVILALNEIKKDLKEVLADRKFYYVRQDLVVMYGNTELFGDKIAKKFKGSSSDLEHAGNCLALGEHTACVLHLIRAMESALKVLGKKLKVTINPKDTWGMILTNMDREIQKLPEANDKQKKKKNRWSECRANLYHVKQAWRDESFHTTRFYEDKEARQILDTVRVFMEQLATL